MAASLTMFAAGVKADTASDEKAVTALTDGFADAYLHKKPEMRAALWTVDGTVAPPPGIVIFQSRDAIVKDFTIEADSVTDTTKMKFSNFRIRFIKPDVAFVDADITVNNVMGPDGKLIPLNPIRIIYTAVKQKGKWYFQDVRGYSRATSPDSSDGAGAHKAKDSSAK